MSAIISSESNHVGAVSISEARAGARRRLREAGISEVRLEADLLVRQATGLTRLDMLLHHSRILDQETSDKLEAFLGRRLKREPLAYVLGTAGFYGLDFKVDGRALVPRPETEILVDKALEAATNLAENGCNNPVLADVGTGSGCIAVSLAVRFPGARIYATDISQGALELAHENCTRHNADSRVVFLHGDLLEPLPERAHVIVANLPYVPSRSLSSPEPELSFEPRMALDGGGDGMNCIERLLAQLPQKIHPDGTILLEMGLGQASSLAKVARTVFPDRRITIFRDLAAIDRVIQIDGPTTARSTRGTIRSSWTVT